MSLLNMIKLSKNNKINELNISVLKKGLKIQKLLEIPYPMKSNYHTEIPLNIFQTWHSHSLPPLMKKNVELIKTLNPAFTYQLFNDQDCYNFIKDNFDQSVLNAFDKLIPGAYKADLWRYCILYKLGGIYLDVKFKPNMGFRCINLAEKEHWVLDADKNGIYNALIVSKPGNIKLFQAINQIVYNVEHNYYGENALHPTGPFLLSSYFNDFEKLNLDMKHIYFINNKKYISFNDFIIFESYDGYLKEYEAYKINPHYGILWSQRKIYK